MLGDAEVPQMATVSATFDWPRGEHADDRDLADVIVAALQQAGARNVALSVGAWEPF